MKNDKDFVIAITLMISGVFANTFGLYNTVRDFSGSFQSILNTFVTTFSLLVIAGFGVLTLIEKKYYIYSCFIVFYTAFVSFPIILLTSPGLVFMAYLPIIGTTFGLIGYKKPQTSLFGLMPLVVYWTCLHVKVHPSIDVFSVNDYVLTTWRVQGVGMTATYIFSLLATAVTTRGFVKYEQALIGKMCRDPLTGVYNRQAFDRDVKQPDITYGAMIDIDFFKKVNDTYGHQRGDSVLKRLCNLIDEYLDGTDKLRLYRYGGEEFFLLSKQTEEDFLKSIKGIWVQVGSRFGLRESKLTMSMGMAKNNKNAELLIRDADHQLYLAKGNGRQQAWYNNDIFSIG